MNEEQEDRGRYVEGSYGKAGSEKGHKAEDLANYGTAGDVPGHAAKDPKGRYVQKEQREEKDA